MTLSEVSISNHRSFCTVGGSFIDRRCQPLNFHETIYGHRFFEAQLPNLIKAMERIADGLAHLEAGSPQSTTPTSSFLHDLYYGDYEPSVFKKQSSEQKKMDKSVSAAEAVLQKHPAEIPVSHKSVRGLSDRCWCATRRRY